MSNANFPSQKATIDICKPAWCIRDWSISQDFERCFSASLSANSLVHPRCFKCLLLVDGWKYVKGERRLFRVSLNALSAWCERGVFFHIRRLGQAHRQGCLYACSAFDKWRLTKWRRERKEGFKCQILSSHLNGTDRKVPLKAGTVFTLRPYMHTGVRRRNMQRESGLFVTGWWVPRRRRRSHRFLPCKKDFHKLISLGLLFFLVQTCQAEEWLALVKWQKSFDFWSLNIWGSFTDTWGKG